MSSDSSPDHIDHVDQPTTKVTKFDLDQLPTSFKQFLKDNDIDPKIYTVDALPRYVRLNTHLPIDKQPTLEDLRQQLGTDQVYSVDKLQNFFEIQLGDKRISDTQAYKDHAIFGIDLSSAIAVEALSIEKDDQVLDLCCAPGAKLCMIANLLGREGLGTATGVDVAGHRLATCRSLLKKYRVGEKIRLFEADGTTFQVPPPSRLGNRVIQQTTEKEPKTKRQKTEITKPFWASKMLRFDVQQKGLYDKVLVDAECTHDGSILHILKYEKWGWDAFKKNFMDPQRLNNVVQLQRDLMRQGWHMLKPGGTMVYSTCSLSIRQNEENVAWFLDEFSNAQLKKIPDYGIQPAKIKQQQKWKELHETIEAHCVRFDPISSRTSGFFLACFIKQ
ncbi:S-adenosyl-L-methionine-dependent methyltransferase [Blakeslea trispora]|nr:S-adenosyl-L-methionine-dependent methyltransferase [Blakeslea trispora]